MVLNFNCFDTSGEGIYRDKKKRKGGNKNSTYNGFTLKFGTVVHLEFEQYSHSYTESHTQSYIRKMKSRPIHILFSY